ncbi:MAG TPA: hypothetical protein VIK14_12340 [Ignavibacteria bacterium]
MKKGKFNCCLSQIVIVFSIITISGCEKSNINDYKNFLGTWISTDLVDTIDFTTDHDFYKLFSGLNDHFLYSSTRDSITIDYNGVLQPFIYVFPETFFYQLQGNELTIDFNKACYGFRTQEIKFVRK